MRMDLEALNGYVLVAVLLFVTLLYFALLFAGMSDFMGRISKKEECRKRPRNRRVGSKPSSETGSFWQRLARIVESARLH